MALKSLRRDVGNASREVLRAIREPALLVWALYLMTVPLYIISSGLPQPADWLVFLLIPLGRMGKRRPLPGMTKQITRAVVAFLLYVLLTNMMWSVILGNWDFSPRYGFLMPPIFYSYNAVMFIAALLLYQRFRRLFMWFTAKIVLCSLLMQVFLSAVHHAPGLRVMVYFNNANQLGFFALLGASMLFLLQRRRYVSSIEVTIGMMAAFYLCLLSASKAALGGIVLLSAFGALVRLRTMLAVGVVLLLSLAVDSPVSDAVDRALHRFETDQSNPQIEERGYDRIYNNPQYLITGSGEGDYERFRETTVIGGHEIHSSIGTLVFCYGVVGLVLFGVFVWLVLRGSGLRTYLLVAPSFAYGMAHQGLRTTLFWVLLALVVATRVETMEEARAKQPAPKRAVRPIRAVVVSPVR